MPVKTYINENLGTRYPFRADQQLPFPCSLIAELKVGVLGLYANSLRVTAVAVDNERIKITLCITKDGEQIILGYIQASTTSEMINVSDIPWCGFMKAGGLSDAANGNYPGNFELDPSCIVPMPNSAYKRYDNIKVNGRTYAPTKQLNIITAGLFDSGTIITSGGVLSIFQLTADASSAVFVQGADDLSYTRVTTINGYSAQSIELTTTGSGGISVSSAVTSLGYGAFPSSGGVVLSGGVITPLLVDLSVRGGTSFPNCYNSSADEANSY